MKFASITLTENVLVHNRMLNKVVDPSREKDDFSMESSEYGVFLRFAEKDDVLIPWGLVKTAVLFPSPAKEHAAVVKQVKGEVEPPKVEPKKEEPKAKAKAKVKSKPKDKGVKW